MANRYSMKSKFLTLNTKFQRQPGQSAQEAQTAGHLNALFLILNYPGLSSITQEGKPCVELHEIATLAGRLFDIYKPLRDGPFRADAIVCAAVDKIDFAIVHSPVNIEEFANILEFKSRITELVSQSTAGKPAALQASLSSPASQH